MASSSGMGDLYAELEVQAGADITAIKKSYRQLVLKYHPDKNPEDREKAEEKIRRINNAYETLGNPSKRAAYDAQARSMFTKASGMRVDSSMIQPRMAIPKAFMLCPIGHPDKFMRAVGRNLVLHSRADVPEVDFTSFFTAAKFSLWWLPEVNNMCRLRITPVIFSGVVGVNDVIKNDGGPPVGSILSFGLSPQDAASDVMLCDVEHPHITNVIAVASPDYPGAFRFEAAFFLSHFLTFDPPTRAQMMRGRDQFAVIDFMLMDFAVAEKFRTVDEVLVPVVTELGGDKDYVKLTSVCQDTRVQMFFKIVIASVWDFTDFAIYFQAHSDQWDYEPNQQLLQLRGVEDKLGRALKRSRTAVEAISILLTPSKQEPCWLPLDAIESGFRKLSEAQIGKLDPSNIARGKDAQKKLLSLLKGMCVSGKRVTLAGLAKLWDAIEDLGENIAEATAAVDAAAAYVSKIIPDQAELVIDFNLLDILLEMPLNWERCAPVLSQKAQQFIAKEPLEKLVHLLQKAAEAKAGKFGECLATSAMMKIFGAEPSVALDALDAMVEGGFGLEGMPMMLRMLLPKVPPEASARVVAGLAEHGVGGADFDACWEAAVADDALAALPAALRERLKEQKRIRSLAQKDVRQRSRSRGKEKK